MGVLCVSLVCAIESLENEQRKHKSTLKPDELKVLVEEANNHSN